MDGAGDVAAVGVAGAVAADEGEDDMLVVVGAGAEAPAAGEVAAGACGSAAASTSTVRVCADTSLVAGIGVAVPHPGAVGVVRKHAG